MRHRLLLPLCALFAAPAFAAELEIGLEIPAWRSPSTIAPMSPSGCSGRTRRTSPTWQSGMA
ncbi:hypothetical protein ACFSHR_11745 [Azotobacter chroococcum]